MSPKPLPERTIPRLLRLLEERPELIGIGISSLALEVASA